MQRYILSRLVQLIITLFIVSLIVFFMVRIKGDPVSVMAPPGYSTQMLEELRIAWGFDKPLYQQYFIFLRKAITGDFGLAIQYKVPAMYLVKRRLLWTYLLAGASALVALAISLPLGILSAVYRNSPLDLISTILATIGTAMPSFWLGIMLILFFSVRLRALPAFGALEPAAIIMPALALGTGLAARLSRLTRSSMLETLREDYIRTARSKGLKFRVVILRHALRNALIPVVTAFGLQLGWLVGGSVVVETVFSWPGLGRLMVDSISNRDITVVQAGLMWFAVSFMLINLAVDVLYTFLDPRVHYD